MSCDLDFQLAAVRYMHNFMGTFAGRFAELLGFCSSLRQLIHAHTMYGCAITMMYRDYVKSHVRG